MAPLQTKGGGNEDHPTISHRPQVFNFKILASSFALFCWSESVSESVRESMTDPKYRDGPFGSAKNLRSRSDCQMILMVLKKLQHPLFSPYWVFGAEFYYFFLGKL